MISLHCWPHKLSDPPSIEGREGQQNTPLAGHGWTESFLSLIPVPTRLYQEEKLELKHTVAVKRGTFLDLKLTPCFHVWLAIPLGC